MTLSSCRKFLLFPLLLPLLAGCVADRTSYSISHEQALTLIRDKSYFWSDEFMRSMVVMSQPTCMRRYRLPPDAGKAGSMKVFRTAEGDYVMQDGLGQYRAEIASCAMSLEDRTSAPGELLGSFEPVPDGGVRFVPASGAQNK